MKRLLSTILAVVFLCSMFAATVSAAPAPGGVAPMAAVSRDSDGLVYHGLQADYYIMNRSYVYTEHMGTYVDPNISFSSMENTLTERTGNSDYAGAIWSGWIVPPETANYTFYAYTDNGHRLYVNDDTTPIINWWVNQWDIEQTSAPMLLEAGKAYYFRMEWMEVDGGSHATLRWENDQNIEKTIIPTSAFYLPDTFPGAKLSGMDTSGAQLNKDEPNFGGTITLNGENLADATVRLGNVGGKPIYPEIPFPIVSNTGTNMTVSVPEDVSPGMFKLLVSINGVETATPDQFVITSSTGTTERPEHPRPTWQRSEWVNLNGWWDFTFDPDEVGLTEKWYEDKEFDLKINVPFPWESKLSGIQNTSYRGQVWYQKEFELDNSWDGKEVFLRFGAVDANCRVYVNGAEVGSHTGGYTPFEFNITPQLNPGTNKITLWVEDKADYTSSWPALVGKQGHNAPCGYTHTSGIWQTVYLEARSSAAYLDYAHANPDVDNSKVQFDVKVTSDSAQTVKVRYNFKSVLWNLETDSNDETGSNFAHVQENVALEAGENLLSLDAVDIPDQKLWNFDSPNLYEGTIELLADDDTVLDVVNTYFGQRKISTEMYDGRDYEYIYVNNEPVFLSGLLDQGFWEEGIYTAPSEEALRFDIQSMREMGFNMIRKHLKIEDPIQYLWADRLGMFVWQDMPHATSMNTGTNGGATPGRPIYEEALFTMLDRDYNHPSVIAIMLFNETWGIDHNGRASGYDGKTTHQWMEYLYEQCKAINPMLLVEDISACNKDHIQPTDLHTFHFYEKGYNNSKSVVAEHEANAYPGSGFNFWGDYTQEGEPWLNSEYGGVAAFDKDWDVSWCFKHQTDIQRQYEKLNGFVYTEPYDIEYERNGVLTYDRRYKIFGYDEIAYGGDMTFSHLTQPNYVGIDVDPAIKMLPGNIYTAPAVAMNWSGDEFTGAKLKWRFDATDVYGNYVSTGIGGEFDIDYKPYTRETRNITFTLPAYKCIGTITLWIEDSEGGLVAKNFVNLIATDNAPARAADVVGNDTYVLRQSAAASEEFEDGAGSLTYTFAVPDSFDPASLNNMRLLVEASSQKDETVNNGISNSNASQTTEGSERASDMTVLVNGHEVDTVYLPDNPRDIRGTLTLLQALNGGSSAGNFGYLVNLNVPDAVIEALKAELAESSTITLTYAVKEDAENKNGLRVYNETTGRYMMSPTVLLNSADVETTGSYDGLDQNYAVEAALAEGESFTVRGGGYTVALSAGKLVLAKGGETLGEAEAGAAANVRARLFDDRISLYLGNNPVPVIDVYDYSGFTGGVNGAMAYTVSPESYEANIAPVAQSEVQFVDHFNTNSSSNTTFASWYQQMGEATWDGSNTDNQLKVDAGMGGKAVIRGTESSDVIVEADINVMGQAAAGANGNLGVIIRGTDYTTGVDGANGYYAGIGVQGNNADNNNGVAAGQGFIEVGRMHQGWTALKKVPAPIAHGETNRLRVVMIGSRLRVYLNDEATPYVDVYDGTYTGGSVALRGFRANGTYDNIVVSTAPRYEADFENGSMNEWTAYLGSWSVADGAMKGQDAGLALVGNHGWSDYEYTADITPEAGAVAGLAVRAMVENSKVSGYFVAVDEANDKLQVIKAERGETSVLAEKAMAVTEGETYTLTVRVVNNALRVYMDGEAALLTATDNSFVTGAAGAIVFAGNAAFDNVSVKDQFLYQEDFYDGSLSGWDIISGTMSTADNVLTIDRRSNGDKLADGYATWSDYTLKADVKLNINPASKSNGGFIFRATDLTSGQDNLRGFVLGINYNQSTANPNEQTGLEFGDIHYGWRAIANTNEFTYETDRWYDMEIRAKGGNITVLIDGQEYYSVDDPAYAYGQFGLRVFNSGMQVKNLRVAPTGDAIPEAVYNVGGQVTAGDTGLADLAGLTVELFAAQDEAFENALGSGVTNTEGNYTVDTPVASGDYVLRIDGQAGVFVTVTLPVTVENTSINNANIELAAPASLRPLLEQAVELAESKEEATYTGDSWAALQTALTEAKAVLADENATNPQMQTALDTLNAAINGLALRGDTSLLALFYELYASFIPGNYTGESWAAMQTALDTAKALLDDPTNAVQAAIDAALDALFAADKQLEEAVLTTPLEMAIAAAEELLAEKDQYIESAVAKLEALVAEAKALLGNNPTAGQVSEMTLKLVDGMSELFGKGNTRALELLVATAQRLDSQNYTPSTWTVFEEKLNAAIAGLEKKDDLVQEEIDKLYGDLSGGISQLVAVANKSGLRTAIAVAQSIVDAPAGSYIPSTIEGLAAKLAAAKAVEADGDASKAAVDSAEAELMAAVLKARKPANKSALKQGLGYATNIGRTGLSQASLAALDAAMADAEKAAQGDDQNAIDAANKALHEALMGLAPEQTQQQPKVETQAPAGEAPKAPGVAAGAEVPATPTLPALKELLPGLFGGSSGKQAQAAPQPTTSEAQAAMQTPAQAEEAELAANAVPQAVQDVTGEQPGNNAIILLLALAAAMAMAAVLLAKRKRSK